jgi:uncharacterized protein YjbI with pentapeptide repeats
MINAGRVKETIIIFINRFEKWALSPKIWILLGILLAAVLLFWYPQWRVSQFGITSPKDLAEMENSYRVTLAQILGGFAVAISLYYTWRRINISQEGQITERFTRAVDQLGAIDHLGNPAMEIRLGGIYALERISRESDKDYWPIMEILTAYVRKNSSFKTVVNKTFTDISIDIQANETTKREIPDTYEVSSDIQAVLIVIKRRKWFFNNGESTGLDLQRTNLRMTDLEGAQLEGANLGGANLKEAYLRGVNLGGANLKKAYLKGANLKKTNLIGANLKKANLIRANLKKANLPYANLEGANLRGANLSYANLEEANLEGANLKKANLGRANLEGANLQGASLGGAYLIQTNLEWAYLVEANLERATLGGADLERANLPYANLEGANLSGAQLEGANLGGANLKEAYLVEANLGGANLRGANLEEANLERAENLSLDQLSQVKTLYGTTIDDELLIPLKEKYTNLFKPPEYISKIE